MLSFPLFYSQIQTVIWDVIINNDKWIIVE